MNATDRRFIENRLQEIASAAELIIKYPHAAHSHESNAKYIASKVEAIRSRMAQPTGGN